MVKIEHKDYLLHANPLIFLACDFRVYLIGAISMRV